MKIRLYMAIFGFSETCEAFSTRIGVMPTRVHSRGEHYSVTGVHEHNGIEIDSGCSQSDPWDSHRGAICEVLARVEEDLRPPAIQVWLRGYVELYESGPFGLFFEPQQLALLGRIGATIEIEVYSYLKPN